MNREAEAIVNRSLEVARGDAGWFNPMLEIAAMRHAASGRAVVHFVDHPRFEVVAGEVEFASYDAIRVTVLPCSNRLQIIDQTRCAHRHRGAGGLGEDDAGAAALPVAARGIFDRGGDE